MIGSGMYLLEGNIGVGKSTFLRLLSQHCPDITVIPEPVDNWSSGNHGKSLLANFYQDPKRWAYTIETLAMISRVKDHTREQQNSNPHRVLERSIYSGHYCFAKNGQAQGFLSNLEWEIYAHWVEFLVHQSCKPPQGFIYLRARPEVCFERVKKRNRVGEEGLTLEYVQQIDEWHDKFLIDKYDVAPHIKNIPVLVLDANHNLLQDAVLLQSYLDKVRTFIKQVPAMPFSEPSTACSQHVA